MKARLLLLAALALAGCGKRDSLKPAEGVALPPKPALAAATPTPDQHCSSPAPEQPGRLASTSRSRRSEAAR